MVIRRAREVDMQAIVDLCSESLMKAYSDMIDSDQIMPWNLGGADIEKYVRGNWPNMMVAWQGCKLAGLVSAGKNHIDMVWVDEEFRHSGIGQNLITQTEEWMAERYSNISVECLNNDMINFFSKRGYEKQREFKDVMSGITKVIMGRDVDMIDA